MYLFFNVYCVLMKCVPSWYNHPGWLGVKRHVTYLMCFMMFIIAQRSLFRPLKPSPEALNLFVTQFVPYSIVCICRQFLRGTSSAVGQDDGHLSALTPSGLPWTPHQQGSCVPCHRGWGTMRHLATPGGYGRATLRLWRLCLEWQLCCLWCVFVDYPSSHLSPLCVGREGWDLCVRWSIYVEQVTSLTESAYGFLRCLKVHVAFKN